MPARSCPDCARRLPYAGRRCIHCGCTARDGGSGGRGAALKRRALAVTVVFLALGLVMAGAAVRNAPQLADWYAGFAAQHLPVGASSYAPVSTATGAFFYCARQVARRMGGLSIETFPSQEESSLVEIGTDRYRIESSVEQSRADGGSLRVEFVCTTHFDSGRWVLDDLTMPAMAG